MVSVASPQATSPAIPVATAIPTASTATVAAVPATGTAAVSVAATPGATRGTGATATTATGVQPAAEFSAERAFEHVEALATTIGSRAATTDGEARAADYIAAQLTGLGYRVTRQPFPVTQLRESRAALSVRSPEQRQLQPEPLQFSGSGEVTAPVVATGGGRAADFVEGEATGKIALIERGDITFREKVERAQAAGAVAVIIYNNSQGQFQGSLGEPVDLPVVALSREEGLWLRQLVEQGQVVEVSLQVQITSAQAMSQNVVGVSPDGPADRPIILVGAHYDSVPAGPGANDNASGTAVMLEMARVLAQEQRAELRFVAFGAEEIGLLGSRAYVAALPVNERQRILVMVNLDMLAVGERLLVGGTDELVDRSLAIASDLGVQRADRMAGAGAGGSDHASFMAAGVPVVFISRPDDPNYHTARDIPRYVSVEALRVAGETSLRLIGELLAR